MLGETASQVSAAGFLRGLGERVPLVKLVASRFSEDKSISQRSKQVAAQALCLYADCSSARSHWSLLHSLSQSQNRQSRGSHCLLKKLSWVSHTLGGSLGELKDSKVKPACKGSLMPGRAR